MSGEHVTTRHETVEAKLRRDLSCFVASEAEFRAAVEAGIAAFQAGPTFALPTIEAELRAIIHSVD